MIFSRKNQLSFVARTTCDVTASKILPVEDQALSSCNLIRDEATRTRRSGRRDQKAHASRGKSGGETGKGRGCSGRTNCRRYNLRCRVKCAFYMSKGERRKKLRRYYNSTQYNIIVILQ